MDDAQALAPGIDVMRTDIAATTSEARRERSERSCIVCHQRKIRCSKQRPCSNCQKANIVCSYPKVERYTKKPPKATITDVSQRLAQLERSIRAGSIEINKSDTSSRTSEPPLQSENCGGQGQGLRSNDAESGELLVHDGRGSGVYINDAVFLRILTEQKELQSSLDTAVADAYSPRRSPQIDIGPVFSGFNHSQISLENSHPTKWQSMQLWKAFLNNFDPVTKVLHTPSTEKILFAALNRPHDAASDIQALLFAIYFAAVSTMSSTDVMNLLDQDKRSALASYKQALEQSLSRANFLESPNVRLLQAMAIYLICLRLYNTGRATWTLSGLVIRAAQSVGLHRDGSKFKLSPFDIEMRRRLWWTLCVLDSRGGEEQGISIGYPVPNCDARLPLNVDDRDLSPEMKQLPAERTGWTEMTLVLVIMEAVKHIYGPDNMPLHPEQTGKSPIQTMDDCIQHFETNYFSHCDENIPIQRATVLCGRLVAQKIRFMVQQKSQKRQDNVQEYLSQAEDTLLSVCEILDQMLQLRQDELLRDHLWLFNSYSQFHLLTYMLCRLASKPQGPHNERAWSIIDTLLEDMDGHNTTYFVGTKSALLRLLRQKASMARQQAGIMADSHVQRSKPEDHQLMDTMAGNHVQVDGLNSDHAMNWDIGDMSFAEWSDFIGSVDMYV